MATIEVTRPQQTTESPLIGRLSSSDSCIVTGKPEGFCGREATMKKKSSGAE